MEKKEKRTPLDVGLMFVAIIVGAIMFICGMLFAKYNFKLIYTNYDEQTIHFRLMQDGYRYCPYCGEWIEEGEKNE